MGQGPGRLGSIVIEQELVAEETEGHGGETRVHLVRFPTPLVKTK